MRLERLMVVVLAFILAGIAWHAFHYKSHSLAAKVITGAIVGAAVLLSISKSASSK